MSLRLKVASEREIVSDSHLTQQVLDDLDCCRDLAMPEQAMTIGAAELAEIVEQWRVAIEREAVRLTKYALSNLDDLPTGCIYDRLGDPSWQRAAQVCEVFRNPSISKNAGRLETSALQCIVHEALKRPGALSFTIGWGQPKRDAGGLKTLGTMADLAEMFAVARLGIVLRAIDKITGREVRLDVLTGGSRFYEALFTRPALTKAYDDQRLRIALALCSPNTISFLAYSSVVGGGGESAAEERRQRFDLTLATVDDAHVATKFATILLNVDWGNILSPQRDPGLRPHGIPLPPIVERWVLSHGEEACSRLVRAAIVSIISPKCLSSWIRALGDEALLEEAVGFMHQVAWESTRKYIALHMVDAHDEASRAAAARGASSIRLTVHEKRDRQEIPALLTLGPRGGNLLSQHVMAFVGARGTIAFESYAELQKRRARPVHIAASASGGLFDWLAGQRQPFCFLGVDLADPVRDIGRVLINE